MDNVMQKMTKKVASACVCVYVSLLAYELYLLTVVFVTILTGASLFLVYF